MKSIVHWCKQKKMWTNHTYLSCVKSPVIFINGYWWVETKPLRKSNPRGWIVTDHTQVTVNPSNELLARFEKVELLLFDKTQVKFSHEDGTHLLFDEKGCFLLREKQQIENNQT